MKTHSGAIELILADIDGCLSGGDACLLDLEMIARLREFSLLSREDPMVPALGFCTGRPQPYVQAFCHTLDAYGPSLAECGAILWRPDRNLLYEHPSFTPQDRRHFHELLAHAAEELVDHQITIEGGKMTQMTALPVPPARIPDILAKVQAFAAKYRERYQIDETHAVVNFLPPAINKGTGMEWLCQDTGIDANRIATIGDSNSDWDFMKLSAVSATPANARPALKEKATWRLTESAGPCMIELYERVIAYNRERDVSEISPYFKNLARS